MVARANLWRWRRKPVADGEGAFPGHGRLTPEQEELRELPRAYRTRDEATTGLLFYIEAFYNPRRRHSSLGYLRPEAYAQRYRQDHDLSLSPCPQT